MGKRKNKSGHRKDKFIPLEVYEAQYAQRAKQQPYEVKWKKVITVERRDQIVRALHVIARYRKGQLLRRGIRIAAAKWREKVMQETLQIWKDYVQNRLALQLKYGGIWLQTCRLTRRFSDLKQCADIYGDRIRKLITKVRKLHHQQANNWERQPKRLSKYDIEQSSLRVRFACVKDGFSKLFHDRKVSAHHMVILREVENLLLEEQNSITDSTKKYFSRPPAKNRFCRFEIPSNIWAREPKKCFLREIGVCPYEHLVDLRPGDVVTSNSTRISERTTACYLVCDETHSLLGLNVGACRTFKELSEVISGHRESKREFQCRYFDSYCMMDWDDLEIFSDNPMLNHGLIQKLCSSSQFLSFLQGHFKCASISIPDLIMFGLVGEINDNLLSRLICRKVNVADVEAMTQHTTEFYNLLYRPHVDIKTIMRRASEYDMTIGNFMNSLLPVYTKFGMCVLQQETIFRYPVPDILRCTSNLAIDSIAGLAWGLMACDKNSCMSVADVLHLCKTYNIGAPRSYYYEEEDTEMKDRVLRNSMWLPVSVSSVIMEFLFY